MKRGATLRRLAADPVIDLPAGEIVLRDEGTMTDWTVEVAAEDLGFRLARSR